MLSRHASSLYWIGRYQERTEIMTKFLQVKYFSTIDASLLEYREMALRSIYFLSTDDTYMQSVVDEGEILYDVSVNPSMNTSILSYCNAVRENSRGVRNLISNELWQILNKNYHFVNGFNPVHLKTKGLFEFTNKVQEHSSTFKAKLESTLLHDDVWAFINLGVYTERAYQIIRLLLNTYIDENAFGSKIDAKALINNQWIICLNTLEAEDMTRRLFNTDVDEVNASNFLMTHLDFPKSIAYSLENINKLIKKIKNSSEQNQLSRDSLIFKAAKLSASVKYLDCDAMNSEDRKEILNQLLTEIFVLNEAITSDFF